MLGLPLLDAMGKLLPSASAAAAAPTSTLKSVQAPVRLACLYFPNGVWEHNWFPEEPGREYCTPFALEPLERHRRDVLGLFRLRQETQPWWRRALRENGQFPDRIARAQNARQRHQCRRRFPGPALRSGTGSPDAIAVAWSWGSTRSCRALIPSSATRACMAATCRGALRQCRSRRKSIRGLHTSGCLASCAPEVAPPRARTRMTPRCLDLVLEDAKRLRGRLGRDDQFKLDEYFGFRPGC